MLDPNKLNQAFNIGNSPTEEQKEKAQETIDEMKDELKCISDNVSEYDPDDILRSNIARLNRVLDRAEEQMEQGVFENRLLEVFSQLANAVTTAAGSIMGNSFNEQQIRIREEQLKLRDKELEIRKAIRGLSHDEETAMGVLTTREKVLEMIAAEDDEYEYEGCSD